MIIKGRARGRSQQLAEHLLRTDQNETVRVFECRGTVAQDVAAALFELEAFGKAAASKRPLYHASISPEKNAPLTDDQVRIAADLLEEKLGLCNQPRVIVLHRKAGREHVHVVWSRIDMEKRRAIPDSWSYRHHEKAARELEVLFGHRHVRGSRTSHTNRRSRSIKDYELRQTERSGLSPRRVSNEITEIWHASTSGAEFRKRLQDAGYTLARGDRRVFVVIDQAGEVHSLTRRIEGVTSKEVHALLADVELEKLPSVSDVRGLVRKHRKRVEIRAQFTRAAREVVSSPLRRTGTKPLPLHALTPGRSNTLSETSVHYRSMRAIIVASFAARIAEAIKNAPRAQLVDILIALKQERFAALEALGRDERAGRGQKATRVKHKLRRRSRRIVRVPFVWRSRRKDSGLMG